MICQNLILNFKINLNFYILIVFKIHKNLIILLFKNIIINSEKNLEHLFTEETHHLNEIRYKIALFPDTITEDELLNI